jgi:diaminohydroxyphosphoribosylaminopyrimidine deaminase/5-amino-6-(5-phosphoribosylamino)uracil reductase
MTSNFGSDVLDSSDDHRYMARALELARRGIALTDPNPSVGCVLVGGGKIIGEGTTARAGGPHAEIAALQQSGASAAGATAYVTLEPCAHHGRTGPCTDALIAAGVKRLVCAALDPNPLVNGRGVAQLEAAGIRVERGLLEKSAAAINPGYVSRMLRGRPWVRMKIASSLDGKTALANGKSQWITGEPARADVHLWRARSSAILTGIGTLLADDPSLTARPITGFDFAPPASVVIDASLRTPPHAKVLSSPGGVFIFHSGGAVDAERALVESGAHIEALPDGAKVDLEAALRRLAELEINTVWVESGPTLSGALVEAQLVDELIVYMAPDLLGGSARSMLNIAVLDDLRQKRSLVIGDVRRIGRDLRITAMPDALDKS